MTLEINVIGIPKGSPRPRAFVRGGHASVYVPNVADDWKACVRSAVDRAYDSPPMLEGPVRLSIVYRMPRPKAKIKSVWHSKRPDLDNMDKATMDALSQAGVWHDDSQVANKETGKVYAKENESPGASIVVRTL